MGFFSKKEPARTAPAEEKIEKEVWKDGRLVLERHVYMGTRDVQVESVSYDRIERFYEATKTLKELKKVKLTRTAKETQSIRDVRARGKLYGIGYLIRDASGDYGCVFEGERIGTMSKSFCPRIAQAYGIKDEELPDTLPCKVSTSEKATSAWSGATVL